MVKPQEDPVATDRVLRDQAALIYRPSLLRFLTRQLRSVVAAEDIVQEAYLRLVRTEHVRDPKAFLFRVAINLARTRATSDKRHRRYQEQVLGFPDEGVELITPERELLAMDALARVTLAIAKLPPALAIAVMVSRYHRLSNAPCFSMSASHILM